MKITVPFIYHDSYIDFLEKKVPVLSSVYFPINTDRVLDARFRLHKESTPKLISGLSRLKAVKKYGLLNTRFLDPGLYREKSFIRQICTILDRLYQNGCLQGIVFNDSYLINALSQFGTETLKHIEAVPGVNGMFDTPEKIHAIIDFIETTVFLPPTRIILDRSLNRDLKRLKTIRNTLKKTHPGIQIELLANEGCIYHCPFKLSHDAQISFANTGTANKLPQLTHTAIGCYRYFFNAPQTFLKSPFIRPEDLNFYHDLADAVKICGRTLGPKFLMKTAAAYTKGSHNGNLLELMDATSWLADYFFIDNKKLDPGFFKAITGCTKVCKTCRMCDDLFKNASKQKSITIRPYKDYL